MTCFEGLKTSGHVKVPKWIKNQINWSWLNLASVGASRMKAIKSKDFVCVCNIVCIWISLNVCITYKTTMYVLITPMAFHPGCGTILNYLNS